MDSSTSVPPVDADIHSFPRVFLQVQHSDPSPSFVAGSQIEIRYWLLGGTWQENDTVRLVLGDTSSLPTPSTSVNDHRYYGLHDLCYDAFEYTEPPTDVSSEVYSLETAVVSWLNQIHSADTETRSMVLRQGRVRMTLPEYGGVFHCSYVREVPSLVTSSSLESVSSVEPSRTASSTLQPPPLARPMSSLVVLATSCTSSSSSSGNSAVLRINCPVSCGPTHQKQVPSRGEKDTMESRVIPHHKRRKGGPLQATTLPFRVFVEHLQQVQRLQVLVSLPSSTTISNGTGSNSCHGSINRIMTWFYEEDDLSPASSASEDKTTPSALRIRLLVEFDYLLPHDGKEDANKEAKIHTEYLFVDLNNPSHRNQHDDDPLSKQTWSLRDIDWAQIHALQQPNTNVNNNKAPLSIADLLRNDCGENLLLLRLPLLSPSTSSNVGSSLTRDKGVDSLLDSVVREYRLMRRFLSKPAVSSAIQHNTYKCQLTCAFCSHPLALLEQKLPMTDIAHSSVNNGEKATTQESRIAVHALPIGLFNEFLHEFICCNNETSNKDLNAEDVDSCMYTMQCEDLQVQRQTLYCGLVACWLHPQHLLSSSSSLSYSKSVAGKRVPSCRFVCKDAASLHDLFTATGAVLMTSPLSLPPPKSSDDRSGNSSHDSGTIPPREVPVAKNKGVDERRRLLQRAFQSIIHTDYCALRCRRCDARLGDARVNFDALDKEEEHAVEKKDVEEDVFPVAAIQHVQFSWHAVRLSLAASSSSASIDSAEEVSVSLLQQAARLVLYIMEKTAKPLVCFYLATSSFPPAVPSSNSDDVEIIVLKVLSKHSNAGAVSSGNILASSKTRKEPLLGLSASLKVAVLMGRASDVLRGNEARIPLEMAEFVKLQRALRETASRWRVYRDVLQVPLPANQDLCFLPL